MRLVFDADVILDVLLEREPFVDASVTAIDLVFLEDVDGCLAGHDVPILHYLLSQTLDRNDSLALLANVLTRLEVAPVTDRVVRQALASPWSDFEDALVHAAALGVGADAIVTRNVKDFDRSSIDILTPSSVVAMLRE